jgi:hypothetical protein
MGPGAPPLCAGMAHDVAEAIVQQAHNLGHHIDIKAHIGGEPAVQVEQYALPCMGSC